MTRRSEFAGAC